MVGGMWDDAQTTREERVAVAAMAAISDVTRTSGAWLFTVPEAPGSPMLNRIVGLGSAGDATEADVDEALAAVAAGVSFYVAVSAAARPAQLPDWLRARGLEPGWGWMSFRRDVDDPPPARTSLRVAEVAGAADAQAFAQIVRESYGLPQELEPRLARTPDSGWSCWLAFDGDEPAAAAALYVDAGAGYLGFAGTRAQHQGKGGQSALLARRILRARELGCDVLVTETGELRDDLPSRSYRNILRAGFTELEVTANWRGQRSE
jgi:GNAT superfamily N-acetyltransferase